MGRSEVSLFRRIFILMVAGMMALLAIVAVTLWLTARVNTHSEDVLRARTIRAAATALLDEFQDMETGQLGYLLTGNRSYLEPYEAARSEVDSTLKTLREALAADPQTAGLTDRVAAAANDKVAELSETIALADAGDRTAALAIVNSDRGKQAMDNVRRLLSGISERADARVEERLGDIRGTTRDLVFTSVFASLLIVLVAGTAIWIGTRYTRELAQARLDVEVANASLEERVRDRTAELSRANEEIQRFAYIVSHDLRAPLVNIVGFTSEMEAGLATLQRAFPADDQAKPDPAALDEARTVASADLPEAIGFIRASTAKMDRLINAILKLSREGRRELRPERVDLGVLLANAAASVQHQLDERGAKLEIAEHLPVIQSDRLALEQVFGNLVDNAVKYLSPDRPGLIRISAEENFAGIVIEIADNGRGIAPADHERIFELFRRAGTQDIAGEGIGLAHVRALVRRLGGEIGVESELGQGSRFKVALPRNFGRSYTHMRA